MKHLIKFLFALLLVQLIACGTDCENCEPIFPNQQMEFSNLGVAQEQLFRVDSILVLGQPGDTVKRSSILKEIIYVDETPDNNTDDFRVQRWTSKDEGLSFTQFATEQYEIQNNELIRSYGNLPFKVLELPYQQQRTWNGARYFDPSNVIITVEGEPLIFFAGEWQDDFELVSFSLSEVVGGIEYDSVITVEQGNHNILTEVRRSVEKYAWKKGLIYREMQIFDELCNQVTIPCRDDLPWELRGHRGFSLKQWRINQ